jgi:CheY-like chemotaxis protein
MLNRLIGKRYSVETDLEGNLPGISADAGNIEQVIMNLILNARDAIPNNGKITIKTAKVEVDQAYCAVNVEARPGSFVCLSVSDTGIGMNKETQARIFEPFFTTKERGKGTGLGLSVVYGIINQHQGWINVYSNPDKGSTFKIYLPVSDTAAQAKPDTRIISPADYKGRGERILVIEDDADILKMASEALGRMNYQVFKSASLKEARDVFKRENGRFHLILSDISLPDGSGLDLCLELKAQKPDIKAILSSGYPSREVNRDDIEKSGMPFITKPYNLTLLFKTIRETLDGASQA